MDSLPDKPFLELVLHLKPENGSEFCLKFLNNSLSSAELLDAPPQAWQVWGIGLAMVSLISFSAAFGIFLLPFLPPSFYDRTLTYFVALGVGTLSGSASFDLLPEAFEIEHFVPNYLCKAWVIIGGIYLFYLVDKFLGIVCIMKEKPELPEAPFAIVSRKPAASHMHIATVAWLVVFGDGLHNFIDGLSIGAAFSVNFLRGVSIAVAVLCEELPQEFGDCAILISSGMSPKQALFYNFASACTCYLGFITGVLAGELDEHVGQFILALAAGMFFYTSLAGMLPEMNKKAVEELRKDARSGIKTVALQALGISTGLVLMYLISQYGSLIQF